jgi:hypothetical protein
VALLSGPSENTKTDEAVAPVAESVHIVALRPVQINSVKNPADGRDIARPVALAAGESYPLPNVDMHVNVSAREAVQFRFRNQNYAAAVAGTTGPGTLSWKTLP